MAADVANGPDATDWAILAELQREGRLPLAELGRRIGLDQATAADRVRRLESTGVISGFHASVDLPRLGFPVLAMVRLELPVQRPQPLGQLLAERREILECLWIGSENCYLLRIAASSMYHLEEVAAVLAGLGTVTTSIVTTTTLPQRGIDAPVDGGRLG